MGDDLDDLLKKSYSEDKNGGFEATGLPSELEKNLHGLDTDVFNDGLEFIDNVSIYDPEFQNKDSGDGILSEIEEIMAKGGSGPEGFDESTPTPEEDLLETSMPEDIATVTGAPLEKKKFRLNKYYIMSGVLVFLIIGVMSAIIIVSRNFKDNTGNIAISKPKSTSNNANYIYLNKVFPVSGQIIDVKSILLDKMATVIYFSNEIDISRYDMHILDEGNNAYMPDISFLNSANVKYMRFSPLKDDAKKFDFIVKDIVNGESNSISFTLEGGGDSSSVLFSNEKQNLFPPGAGFSGTLDKAVFSGSGSTIYFSFKYKNPENILYIEDSQTEVAEMHENVARLLGQREKPIQFIYGDDGLSIGRMDFEPVKNLNSKVYIKFNNIFRSFEYGKEIDPSGLFLNNEESQQKYTVGNYDIILERMGRQGDRYVLVMHAENNAIFGKSSLENDLGHIEIIPDIELVFESPDGKEIKSQGEVFSADIGTDVVFDVGGISEFAGGKMSLKINSLSFKLETLEIEVDLEKCVASDGELSISDNEMLHGAFMERLRYKSGEINEVGSFSDSLMADSQLLRYYSPEPMAKNISYGLNVLTSYHEGEKIYAAVVDSWQAETEYGYKRASNFHKVVANVKNNGSIEIIEDDILTD
ncbi:MAG: hypothetical protein LBV08_05845 [Clostridiales bacterium]|jgi:hypothetical protein|nr:hypothetical protein [Clostridiales bacterium]